MRIRLLVVAACTGLLTAGPLCAAQSGERSVYDSNPECLERNAPSDKCVIDDGLPVHRAIRKNPTYTVQPAKPAGNAATTRGAASSGSSSGGGTMAR